MALSINNPFLLADLEALAKPNGKGDPAPPSMDLQKRQQPYFGAI
jgi:hypothetical protein